MTATTFPPSQPQPPNPRVGVGVFITRPISTTTSSTPTSKFEFILGQRLGSHGANTWALPGGHLEHGESFETCAAREVQEETGLTVTNIRFMTATNDVMASEGKHYITVFVACEIEGVGGEPEVLEPEKCAGWEWACWEEMVGWLEGGERELFLPLVNLVRTRPGVGPSLF